MASTAQSANPFNVRTILLAIVAGVVAFAGFLVLTAYAPEWRMRTDSGAHAMSKSAVGFFGLKELAASSGRKVDLYTDKEAWFYSGLNIVPLAVDTDRKALKELIATRHMNEDAVTLYILPKWVTAPDPLRPKWVRNVGTFPTDLLKTLVEPIKEVSIAEAPGQRGMIRGEPSTPFASVAIPEPKTVRYLSGGIDPMLTDSAGHVVMGSVESDDGAIDYILADPDLLNNQGIKSRVRAAGALAIVDAMRFGPDDSVAFDMVLAGGGEKRNLLRLMFEPPFLAFTLALVVAAIMIGVHALGRFGPPKAEGRAIAFGKHALVESASTLIARAKRERALGERYVAAVREAAAQALGARARDPQDLEAWLDTLPGNFAARAAAVRAAPDALSLRDAAADLHRWKKDIIRDR